MMTLTDAARTYLDGLSDPYLSTWTRVQALTTLADWGVDDPEPCVKWWTLLLYSASLYCHEDDDLKRVDWHGGDCLLDGAQWGTLAHTGVADVSKETASIIALSVLGDAHVLLDWVALVGGPGELDTAVRVMHKRTNAPLTDIGPRLLTMLLDGATFDECVEVVHGAR